MEITRQFKKNPNLHSPNHALAEELSQKLNDKRHFAMYLKMAVLYDHNVLRRIAGEVLEGKATRPGALFAYLIKKNNDLKKNPNPPEPNVNPENSKVS